MGCVVVAMGCSHANGVYDCGNGGVSNRLCYSTECEICKMVLEVVKQVIGSKSAEVSCFVGSCSFTSCLLLICLSRKRSMKWLRMCASWFQVVFAARWVVNVSLSMLFILAFASVPGIHRKLRTRADSAAGQSHRSKGHLHCKLGGTVCIIWNGLFGVHYLE